MCRLLNGESVAHLPRLRSALPTRCGREATPRLPGFTYITLPVWKSLEMPYRNVRTVSRMASEEYYLRNIDVPAGEDHEALNLPLGCSRLPTNASFKCSQYARGYNRQTRDTSGSH